jgi:hypothetical protein
VYILRYAFEFQFNLKYSTDDLCIFPLDIQDNDDLKEEQYTIKANVYQYSDILMRILKST